MTHIPWTRTLSWVFRNSKNLIGGVINCVCFTLVIYCIAILSCFDHAIFLLMNAFYFFDKIFVKPTYSDLNYEYDVNCFHVNFFSSEMLWALLHKKLNILNIYFFLLWTENQLKVAFKVNFWLPYQIGHNYKDDEFIISI